MIYIIKFIYTTFILPPGSIILLLLMLGIYTLKKNRKIAIALLSINLLLYICSIGLFSDAITRSLEQYYTVPSALEGDVIIMLGGGAVADSDSVHGKGTLTGHAGNRLLTSAALYNRTRKPILVSGGSVYKDSGSEGDIAADILKSLGVLEKDIIIENKSLNTEQNVELSKKLIQGKGYSKPILVTSAFHMRRAVKQFKKAGIEVTPYPCDYMVSKKSYFGYRSFIPYSGVLEQTAVVFKEYLGLLK